MNAQDLLTILEKGKVKEDKPVDGNLLDQIINNLTDAKRYLSEGNGDLADKKDRLKFNNCLLGMRGTSMKCAELAKLELGRKK